MESWIINKIGLKPEEEVVEVVRSSFLPLWPNILFSFLFIAIAFFFMFPLFRLGYWGIALFAVLIFIGIYYGIKKFSLWYFNVFILTNERVIDIEQKGFFDRTVSEVSYEKIRDVSYRRKGFFETIFRYGSVRIQTSIDKLELEVKKIKNPKDIHELILDLCEREKEEKKLSRDKDGSRDSEKFLDEIKEDISSLETEHLRELLRFIREKIKQQIRE